MAYSLRQSPMAQSRDMRTLLNAAGVIAILAAASPSLLAQWPGYQVPGVPRTPDGNPNLNAPAPRTADGKPDLSGIWENVRSGGGPGERVVNAAFFDSAPPSLIPQERAPVSQTRS